MFRAVTIAAGLLLWFPSMSLAATFFSENFNAGQNSNLTGYGSFTLGGGVIRRNGSFQDVNDRRYMRTLSSDYNTVDFRYELTFTTSFLSQTSINFIGIGSGDRRPGPSQFGHNEPWESLFFRIHTPNVDGGFVGIGNHPATNLLGIGSIPTAGLHRARIEKSGSVITFSIDAHYDGVYVADLSHTFPNLSLVAPFLDNTNSRLFFGTVFPDDSFDDMLVVPEPSTVALVDIKPGSDPNSVNLKGKGVLPVAILSTDDFDVHDVDINTLLFGDPLLLDNGGTAVSPLRSAFEDVSGDGLLDLSLKFSVAEMVEFEALWQDTIEGLLTGELLDGTPFAGTDSIRIVPPKWSNRNDLAAAIPSPEPSTVILAAIGLIGLAAFGWRRRKR